MSSSSADHLLIDFFVSGVYTHDDSPVIMQLLFVTEKHSFADLYVSVRSFITMHFVVRGLLGLLKAVYR